MNRWINFQTLVAGAVAFVIGFGSQVYAVSSWKTEVDLKLEEALSISELTLQDHDKLIRIETTVVNIDERLDRFGTAFTTLRSDIIKMLADNAIQSKSSR